jgi:hypothetical protein
LIVTTLIELRTPHLMHALMLGSAEGHGRSKPNVKIADIFKSPYQFLGVKLRATALQGCDQDIGVNIAFE